MEKNRTVKTIIFIFLPLLFLSTPANALYNQNSSNISNDIKVEANTGGNTATNKTSGEAKASVQIKTEINGEEVQNINETIQNVQNASGTKKIEINEEKFSTSSNASVKTKIKLEVTGESTSSPNAHSSSAKTSPALKTSQIFWKMFKTKILDTLHNFLKLFNG